MDFGPEISLGTVPKFPQKVSTKLLCLIKGHFPLVMLFSRSMPNDSRMSRARCFVIGTT